MSATSPPQAPEFVIAPAVRVVPRRRLRVMQTVTASHDLHMRIAAHFVKLASRFESKIMLAKGRRRVDGKSILGIMMLGAARDSRLRIIAIGRDAEEAVRALTPLFHHAPRSAR